MSGTVCPWKQGNEDDPSASPRSVTAVRTRGFTLIEMMITVAIIAILAAVAYPAYTEQVAKGRRAEAKAVVLEATQWMERFYAENYRYDQNSAGTEVTDEDLFPRRFPQSPKTGGASYNIELDNLAATTFTVIATRTGSMTGDKCGDLAMTHTGVKKIENWGSQYAGEEAAVADCWK